ncbi:hypothetical protein [Vitreimonas sp.]|jgi:hypothetical protein|uniref:hypothetical protein n=1 Tax=Vitreimonas sp. TaxID=3069702 RepID=UPI002ED7FD64
MRADDDVTYLTFKVRVTAPNGFVAEGECVAKNGRADFDRARGAIIDLVRTSADQWEFASSEAG